MAPHKRKKHPRLADRDYEILDHISRYHMTTREVLHELFFNESELNAVTKVTSRLVEYQFLNGYDFHSGKKYFVFGPAGAKLFGISPKKCAQLGPQALVEKYGILQFCCATDVPREKLLVHELTEHLQTLKGKHLGAGTFYLDQQGPQLRLAQMRVDHGGPAAHVVRKCRSDLETRLALPQIAELVAHKQFMLAIITSSEQKVRDIQEALQRHTWPIFFRLEAVSDLAPLIAAQHHERLNRNEPK